MKKYKCINKDCSEYDIIKIEYDIYMRYHKDGTITDMHQSCPKCGKIRIIIEEVEENIGLCTNMYSKTGNLCTH